MNINSMSEVLNKFVSVLEARNQKFSNANEDFLMPLPESTKEEMKNYFSEVAPGFLYLKSKTLLNENGALENEISEKQMYDIYQITKRITNSNSDNYNNTTFSNTNNSEEMYNKLSNAYLERNDLLFIPNLEKNQRTLSSLTSLLRASSIMPQNKWDRESLEKSIKEVSLGANSSLEEVKQYKERNEGISHKLENSANQVLTGLTKLNEEMAHYQETKRIFEKNSQDPFNFNTREVTKTNENSSVQEIEAGKMSSHHVHSMLNLNKTMVELRNQYILRVDDHSSKKTLS